jgi:hypothetical protein
MRCAIYADLWQYTFNASYTREKESSLHRYARSYQGWSLRDRRNNQLHLNHWLKDPSNRWGLSALHTIRWCCGNGYTGHPNHQNPARQWPWWPRIWGPDRHCPWRHHANRCQVHAGVPRFLLPRFQHRCSPNGNYRIDLVSQTHRPHRVGCRVTGFRWVPCRRQTKPRKKLKGGVVLNNE